MPSRVLRDWTDSTLFEKTSCEAERLFTRLIMKADDFGRYHADVRLIRAGCFPVIDGLRDTELSRWLEELQPTAIVVYEVNGRKYLAIRKFRQRMRQMKAKFPPPQGKPDGWLPPDDPQLPDNCLTVDGQLTVNRRPDLDLDSDLDLHLEAGGGMAESRARKLINAHPMLVYDPKMESEVEKLLSCTKSIEAARALIDEAVANKAVRPTAYALAIVAGKQNRARAAKSAPASAVAVRKDV